MSATNLHINSLQSRTFSIDFSLSFFVLLHIINKLSVNQNNIYKVLNSSFRLIIICLAFGFLIYQLFFKKDIIDHLQLFYHSFENSTFVFYIVIAIILMPVNWILESIKWRYLIKLREEITLKTAIKAVVAGISLSSITPNRVGEFFARLFVLKQTRFWEGVFMTIIGSFSQTIITLMAGLFSILIFITMRPEWFSSYFQFPLIQAVYVVLMGISILAILIVYFKISWFYHLIPAKWRRIRIYFMVLQKYSSFNLIITLLLSLVRYLVFSFQFILLFWALQIPISLSEAFLIVSLIFFINTINPSIALLELGVRGSISIFVMSMFFDVFRSAEFNFEIEVLIASSVIWLINIVLPAFIGLFFIKELNFFRFKTEPHDD